MYQYRIFRLFNSNYKEHVELARQVLQDEDFYKTKNLLAVPYMYSTNSKNKLFLLNESLTLMIFSNEFFYNAIKSLVENSFPIQKVSLIEGHGDNEGLQRTVDIMTMKLLNPSTDKSNLNGLLEELEWLSKEEDIDISSIDFKLLDNGIFKTITIEKMGHILIHDKDNLSVVINLIEKSL